MTAAFDEEARARGRERALAARRERARIKREVREGSLTIEALLERRWHDPAAARMKVSDLLEALPRIGPVRAAELMERCDIAPSRRLRGLGEHQVAALLDSVGSAS